jgi:hypothetical protein
MLKVLGFQLQDAVNVNNNYLHHLHYNNNNNNIIITEIFQNDLEMLLSPHAISLQVVVVVVM